MKKLKRSLSIAASMAVLIAGCCIPVFANALQAPAASLSPPAESEIVESTPSNSGGDHPAPAASAPADESAAPETDTTAGSEPASAPPVPLTEETAREIPTSTTQEILTLSEDSEGEEVKNTVTITILSEDGADTSGIAFTVVELDEKDFVDKGVVTKLSESVHKTEDGKLVLTNLRPNVYTFETEPLENYQPAFKVCLTVEEYGEFSDYLNLLLPEQRGNLEIKLDAGEGDELPDAVFFTVTGEGYEDGCPAGTIEGLKPGTYTVWMDAIEGYEAPPPQTVDVKDGEVSALAFAVPRYKSTTEPGDSAEDTRPGFLSVVAASDDGKTKNVMFKIQGVGCAGIKGTGRDGQLFILGLVPGEYTITPMPREGYLTDGPRTVTVSSGETSCETFGNTKIEPLGDLTIQLSPDKGDESAFGALFNIKGEEYDTDVWTDHTGSKIVYNLKAGEYTVTQRTQGDTHLSITQKVLVEDGRTATVDFVG